MNRHTEFAYLSKIPKKEAIRKARWHRKHHKMLNELAEAHLLTAMLIEEKHNLQKARKK